MNSDQIGGLVRTILSAIGGYFVARGWLDASTLTAIVGAVTTLIVTGWSIWSNKPSSLVASVAAIPAVDNAKLAQAIADPDLKQAAKA